LFWYDFEKTVALQSFDGYSEYKITIPQKYFTYSLKPRTKNKILKLTPKNIKEFIKLHKKYYSYNHGIFLKITLNMTLLVC
jgi:hypothetical protein